MVVTATLFHPVLSLRSFYDHSLVCRPMLAEGQAALARRHVGVLRAPLLRAPPHHSPATIRA
jgi:hypothetical protein